MTFTDDNTIDDLVDVATIAVRLGLRRPQVIHTWLSRGVFPVPRRTFGTGRAVFRLWLWPDIQAWQDANVPRLRAASRGAGVSRGGRPPVNVAGLVHDGATVLACVRAVGSTGRIWSVRCLCGDTFERRAAHIRRAVKLGLPLQCAICAGRAVRGGYHRGHADDAETSLLGLWAAVVREARAGHGIAAKDTLSGDFIPDVNTGSSYVFVGISLGHSARRWLAWDPERTTRAVSRAT